jgi:tyrosine-protein phosphatase SIW14
MQLNKTRTRIYTVALLTALSLAGPAAAETRSTAGDISKVRIDNFGVINPNYYRGAQPDGRDYADLAALGVKTLINLTSDDAAANEQTMAEQAGMAYVQIPMSTREVPTGAKLAAFLEIVNDPARQPVYVHCVGGRHRTGVMTAVYRMTQDGWTPDQAFKEMKQYKFGADFLHPEFKEFVYGYRAEPAHAATLPVATSTPKTKR